MCHEMPYEKLNALTNDMAHHGKYRWGNSVREIGPDIRVFAQEFSRYVSLTERSGVDMALIHEYIPTQKISSVARDATAFSHREPKGHVVVISSWEDNHEENFKFVKEATDELLAITVRSGVSKEEKDYFGYGNYLSISSGLFTLLATCSTISR
jgi:hypothetical protein